MGKESDSKRELWQCLWKVFILLALLSAEASPRVGIGGPFSMKSWEAVEIYSVTMTSKAISICCSYTNHLKERGRKSEGGKEVEEGEKKTGKKREGGRESHTENERKYSIHIISSLEFGGG